MGVMDSLWNSMRHVGMIVTWANGQMNGHLNEEGFMVGIRFKDVTLSQDLTRKNMKEQ